MSEEIDTAEVTTGMDRRSVLKKAALVGAVAWTAPIIVSNTAFASSCTPGCAPQSIGNLDVVVTDLCANLYPGLVAFLKTQPGINGPPNKIVKIRVVAPDGYCPCAGNPAPSIIVSSVPTVWSKGNDSSPGCDPFKPSKSNPLALGGPLPVSAGYTLASDEFLIFKDGAMPSGWYTGNVPICVSVGCADDVGGDLVFSNCKYRVCFDYSPEGSCGSVGSYGSNFVPASANNCNPSCGTPNCT